jgi:hypothetical protein
MISVSVNFLVESESFFYNVRFVSSENKVFVSKLAILLYKSQLDYFFN